MYCIVLGCLELYLIVLYCIVLYCVRNAVSLCVILSGQRIIFMHCMVLYCIVLYNVVLNWIGLNCFYSVRNAILYSLEERVNG